MTDLQWLEVTDDLLKKLWPEWKVTSIELETWHKKLHWFDLEIVKKAIQEFYSTSQGSFKRPKLHAIRTLCYEYSRQPDSEKRKSEPLLIYTIECYAHDDVNLVGRKYRYYSSGKMRVEDINEATCIMDAEKTVRKYNQSYDGTWIFIRDWVTLMKKGTEDES